MVETEQPAASPQTPAQEFEALIDKIRTNAAYGRNLEEAEQRIVPFVRAKVKAYAQVIGLPELAVLKAIEGKRDYWAMNYYQEANFPDLGKDVLVLETKDDFLVKFPSKQFFCPACGGTVWCDLCGKWFVIMPYDVNEDEGWTDDTPYNDIICPCGNSHGKTWAWAKIAFGVKPHPTGLGP